MISALTLAITAHDIQQLWKSGVPSANFGAKEACCLTRHKSYSLHFSRATCNCQSAASADVLKRSLHTSIISKAVLLLGESQVGLQPVLMLVTLAQPASVFAETSVQLQALEKISHEHPAACLRHGGLLASLSYLDFFQTGVQRVAVATAANMCRSVTSENTDAVASAIPILTNLLQYQVDIHVACITNILGMCEALCTPGCILQ